MKKLNFILSILLAFTYAYGQGPFVISDHIGTNGGGGGLSPESSEKRIV